MNYIILFLTSSWFHAERKVTGNAITEGARTKARKSDTFEPAMWYDMTTSLLPKSCVDCRRQKTVVPLIFKMTKVIAVFHWNQRDIVGILMLGIIPVLISSGQTAVVKLTILIVRPSLSCPKKAKLILQDNTDKANTTYYQILDSFVLL